MECILVFLILVLISLGNLLGKGFPREGKGTFSGKVFHDDNE